MTAGSSIGLPRKVRNWLQAKFLEDPEPQLFRLKEGEPPEPVVMVELSSFTDFLIEEEIDLLPALGALKEAGLIEDIKVSPPGKPPVRVLGICRSVLSVPIQSPSPPTGSATSDPAFTGAATDRPEATHSDDFRSVQWYGTRYEFTPAQAACVRVLWEHWERGTPAVSQAAVLERADVSGSRLSDVFRRSPAWGTMIVPASARGLYCLLVPKAGGA